MMESNKSLKKLKAFYTDASTANRSLKFDCPKCWGFASTCFSDVFAHHAKYVAFRAPRYLPSSAPRPP